MDRIGPRTPARHFIEEWMDKEDVDQRRISERMECQEGTISKLLSGKMKMTTEWLNGFAQALNVEVSDLFRDPNAPSADELLRNATPDQRRLAFELITSVLNTGTGGK